jgi:hypothetical protein
MLRTSKYLLGAACLLAVLAASASRADSVADSFPATPDPFSGNYVGRWSAGEDVDPDIAAQVDRARQGQVQRSS